MKILLMSRYESMGASSRVRFYQYLPYLRAAGFEVEVCPLMENGYVQDIYAGRNIRWGMIIGRYFKRLAYLLKTRRYDLLWIQGELFPWNPGWIEQILGMLKVPFIVDYDDAIFHRYHDHPNMAVRLFLGGKIDSIMRRASLVIAGNYYVAEHARNAGASRVEYLPSVVDISKYKVAPVSSDRTFTVGWIGTQATAHYLSMVQDALAQFCKEYGAQLMLIGPNSVYLGGVPIKTIPWNAETEVTHLHKLDVGIMPLPDKPWERGKSGYKLIQYMACGLPVVSSPVGVNQVIVEDGVNGFSAATNEGWLEAFERLRGDVSLQRSMGQKGRKKVEAQYSLQTAAPQLTDMLRSVINA